MKRIDLARLILAIGFFLEENNYFGCNAWPQSVAELTCDGIVFLLLSLSWIHSTKDRA